MPRTGSVHPRQFGCVGLMDPTISGTRRCPTERQGNSQQSKRRAFDDSQNYGERETYLPRIAGVYPPL